MKNCSVTILSTVIPMMFMLCELRMSLSTEKLGKKMNYTKTWVGIIPSIEEIIVYDPEMQLKENNNTYVYSNLMNSMVEKQTEFLEKNVIRFRNGEEQGVVNEYLKWKKEYGDDFLINEKNEMLLIAKELEREQKKISKGTTSKTKQSSNLKESYKIFHCFSCDQIIDSWVETRCSKCGWVICNCGACNC